MNYEKVQLLVNNSRELDKAGGIFTGNSFRKCNALLLILKGRSVDSKKINQAIEVIKYNTSILSNFRGYNLLTTATTISLEENMKGSFIELMSIYDKLKGFFFTNQYLILAAIVIFNARDRVDIDDAVKNTRKVYDYMKKKHRFLTGQEDISAAAMIATTSINIELTLNEIEECYEALIKKGFGIGNNTQSLSHILPLFSGSVEEKVQRVFNVNMALKNNGVPLRYYSLPILGVVAGITDDPNAFAKEVKEVNDKIKSEKGFGTFTLGSTIRNMIATGLVASYYVDRLNEEDKQTLIDTTNNIAIAIEIATVAATTGAVAAASSSN